jgi:hypothetical protein
MPDLPTLQREDIQAELIRAEVELLYAIAKHRKAWKAMRARADERAMIEASGAPGRLASLEADHIWKLRTGDVTWWRGEMTAQATAVTALKAMLADTKPEKPVADDPRSVREIVFDWDGKSAPSGAEVNAARWWLNTVGPKMGPEYYAQCNRIILAHDKFPTG